METFLVIIIIVLIIGIAGITGNQIVALRRMEKVETLLIELRDQLKKD